MEHSAEPHVLADMLRFMRPDGSNAEKAFIAKYIDPLGCEKDSFGNRYKRIGTAPILWSSHTDTVHINGGRQNVAIKDGIATSTMNCLGADCTTGVFIMRQMIFNGVEGLYIFHRAEEVGGIGSRHIAKTYAKALEEYKFAIAFDRKGETSIITHQGSRCCSDEFADSLTVALDMKYIKDDGGTFTDTANYTDYIPECTNISVGYYAQHTKSESQDVDFACRLADRMCVADFTKLVEKRVKGTTEYKSYYGKYYPSHGRTSYGGYEDYMKPQSPNECVDIMELLEAFPISASKVLETWGVKYEELRDAMNQRMGYKSKVAADNNVTYLPKDKKAKAL